MPCSLRMTLRSWLNSLPRMASSRRFCLSRSFSASVSAAGAGTDCSESGASAPGLRNKWVSRVSRGVGGLFFTIVQFTSGKRSWSQWACRGGRITLACKGPQKSPVLLQGRGFLAELADYCLMASTWTTRRTSLGKPQSVPKFMPNWVRSMVVSKSPPQVSRLIMGFT